MKISVVIPVGPYPDDKRWLDECLESVRQQTLPADEVLFIDDMAMLDKSVFDSLRRDGDTIFGDGKERIWDGSAWRLDYPIPEKGKSHFRNFARIWPIPWKVGVAAAMNFGIALAHNDLVFMLCADDTLHPECLERCLDTYRSQPADTRDLSYYFVGVKYLDGRAEDEQYLPCGAAMVTKELWRTCGGFPPEAASGAPDAALLSTMMVHSEAGRIVGVSEHDRACLYNYRPHNASDSAKRAPWQGVILETRDILTRDWQPPKWARMS